MFDQFRNHLEKNPELTLPIPPGIFGIELEPIKSFSSCPILQQINQTKEFATYTVFSCRSNI